MADLYKCRCGHMTQAAHKPPAPCLSCPRCGTTLTRGAERYGRPMPCKFEQIAGQERCRYCYRTRGEVEKDPTKKADPAKDAEALAAQNVRAQLAEDTL